VSKNGRSFKSVTIEVVQVITNTSWVIPKTLAWVRWLEIRASSVRTRSARFKVSKDMADCYAGNFSPDFYGQADYYRCLVNVPNSGLSCSSSYPLIKICHINATATDRTMDRMDFTREFWSLDSGKAWSGNYCKCGPEQI
jgi:hypothetical protein